MVRNDRVQVNERYKHNVFKWRSFNGGLALTCLAQQETDVLLAALLNIRQHRHNYQRFVPQTARAHDQKKSSTMCMAPSSDDDRTLDEQERTPELLPELKRAMKRPKVTFEECVHQPLTVQVPPTSTLEPLLRKQVTKLLLCSVSLKEETLWANKTAQGLVVGDFSAYRTSNHRLTEKCSTRACCTC